MKLLGARACAVATLAGLAALGAPRASLGQTPTLAAPNVVPIAPRLVTSGQPSAAALSALGTQGFGAVIYLAPPGAHGEVADERERVEHQGLVYVNIPIDFAHPTEQDFDRLVAAIEAANERKVLVHCQLNMRASSMVFLYRVIVGKESPETAYEAVSRVWVPDSVWKRYIVAMLGRHGIVFEPY